MSNPPKTNSTKQSSQPPSTTNSTDKDIAAALLNAVRTIEETRSLAERLLDREKELIEREDRLLERERPLRDFHEAIKGTTEADVRIYWDVRIVRGEDIPFTRATGSTSFPGMLSQKMKAHAPSMIQQEVMDKIAHPLVAAFMEEAENQNAAVIRRIAARPMLTHEVTIEAAENQGGDIMSTARKQENDMAAESQDDSHDDE